MVSYNIRVLHSGRDEYRGSIIVDKDRTIYGKGTEENYDNETVFMGHLSKSKKTLILKLISSKGNITELKMSQNEYFPQKSIASSICFYGFNKRTWMVCRTSEIKRYRKNSC